LIYALANVANPADGNVTFDTLAVANFLQSGAGAILVLAILGFVGFEASVVFSEESRNPRRTVQMATYVAIAVIGLVYVLSSWAMSVATGPDNIVPFTQENQAGTIFVLADMNLGSTWVEIGETLFVTSVLAAMISFHNTCARYGFALGRERVLLGALGQTSARSGAPIVASIIQSAIGLAVILIYAGLGLDPLVQLFFYGGTTGGFGVLVLITLTSIAIVGFFAREPSGENAWRRVIAPVFAAIALVCVVVLAVANYDILIGVAPGDPLRWILPSLFVVAGGLGVAWALYLKVARPDVYETIGRGANAATGMSVLDMVSETNPANNRSIR
jgi:amino acid transporter